MHLRLSDGVYICRIPRLVFQNLPFGKAISKKRKARSPDIQLYDQPVEIRGNFFKKKSKTSKLVQSLKVAFEIKVSKDLLSVAIGQLYLLYLGLYYEDNDNLAWPVDKVCYGGIGVDEGFFICTFIHKKGNFYPLIRVSQCYSWSEESSIIALIWVLGMGGDDLLLSARAEDHVPPFSDSDDHLEVPSYIRIPNNCFQLKAFFAEGTFSDLFIAEDKNQLEKVIKFENSHDFNFLSVENDLLTKLEVPYFHYFLQLSDYSLNALIMDKFGPNLFEKFGEISRSERAGIMVRILPFLVEKIDEYQKKGLIHGDIKFANILLKENKALMHLQKEDFIFIDWGNYENGIYTKRYAGKDGPLRDLQSLAFSMADVLEMDFPDREGETPAEQNKILCAHDFASQVFTLSNNYEVNRKLGQVFLTIQQEDFTVESVLKNF